MNRFYLLLSLLFAVLYFPELSAQRPEKFSENHSEFLNQLGTYMTSGKHKELEDSYREFSTVFKSGMFSAEEMDQILKTTNKMLDLRVTANPYFGIYLRAVMAVKRQEDGAERFKEWHAVVDNVLANEESRQLKTLQDFSEFSIDFFKDRALRNAVGGGTSWYTKAGDFKLRYEDNTPKVVFEKLDLVGIRQEDSIVIRNTSGVFYPVDAEWRGEGGTVTWERLGLEPDVYVELGAYNFEVKQSLYEVPEAKLHYPLFFGNEVIEGSFSDKLVSSSGATEGSYPRFESKRKILEVRNLGKGINFRGGFKMQGSTIYGYGTKDNKSRLTLLDDKGEVVFQGDAELFTIKREERIVGERVDAVLYLGQDSLYHPSINLRFEIPTREIQLTRGQRGSDRNPFFNSMHQMNIDAETINAYIDQDSVVIGKPTVSISTKGDVYFESLGYFRKKDYQVVQNIATVNPIAIMKVTAEKEGTNFISAALLAERINSKFTVENIQSLLYDLVSKGFINYDSDKQLVEVKEKVFHYADADQNKVDYDVLKIKSETRGTNAVLNLRNRAIVVNGVGNIEFSARQRVAINPHESKIELIGNRNIRFDGSIFAGFSMLEGKDFQFQYDKFQVNLDSVRYFDFFVPTGEFDKNQNPVALSIGSRIEHLEGVLLIDAPSNKSGKEDITMFPSLQSKNFSYVYYDGDSTQSSTYPRDSFYFRLEPFSFDHLDRYTAEDLKFKGKLYSNEIFPVIEETLVLQEEDQSLGFSNKTPEGGLPNYQGKGNYTGDINLSNRGLIGNGNLKYLGASVNSEDIIFKPKEALATAERFDLEEDRKSKVQVPQVRGEDVSINWRPYKDSMYVTPRVAPFAMYKHNNHTLKGTLILTPTGLKGDGLLDWDKANMRSKDFAFGAFTVHADTTNLNIKAFESDELALHTDNVTGDVDFDKEVATFTANDEFLVTTLPYNQYVTSMNEFNWDMKRENIVFKTDQDNLGTFTSIHPDQDSLQFKGANSTYNLKTSLLEVEGVPYIVSADAFIYPDSNYVVVQPGGIMTKLENAQIIADTLNKYHVINRATVEILGRKEFRASGFYEYNISNREQEIELQNIVGTRIGKGDRSEKRTTTRATGEVTPADSFYIDYKTAFQGTISLNAESKNLQFDGFARLDTDKLPNPQWFTVSSEGDKKDLAIRFDQPKSFDGEPLFTGLYLSKETSQVYPRAMMPLHFRKDRPILPVTGVFKYNNEKDEFIFGDSSKILRQQLVGNLFVVDNKDATVQAEGKFIIGSGLKYVSVDAAGTATTVFPPPTPEELAAEEEVVEEILEENNIMLAEDPVEEEAVAVDAAADTVAAKPALVDIPLNLDLMAGIKMIVPEQLLKIISNDIKSSSFDAKSIGYLTDISFYKKAAHQLFPADKNKEVKEIIDAMSSGFLDIPSKYNPYTFLFSRIKMKWDAEYQSFVSTDKNIGLVSINGESINKTLECYVEFKMPSNEDDRLYIYIKSPSQLFYFFGFKQGIMSITSNNPSFMESLEGLKGKDLIQKMPDGETYEIQVVEPGSANLFLRRVQAVAKG